MTRRLAPLRRARPLPKRARLGLKPMFGTAIREILAEEEEVQLHLEALDSLLHRYSKRGSESLEERIKRAHANGEWLQFSLEECSGLQEQEKLHLQSLFETLHHELKRTRRKLTSLKQAKKRARKILAEEASRKQHW